MPKPYVSFADLSAKTLLYQGLDRQGALKFHTNIGRIFNKNTFLQSNILLALALTSLCRETGQGKVIPRAGTWSHCSADCQKGVLAARV